LIFFIEKNLPYSFLIFKAHSPALWGPNVLLGESKLKDSGVHKNRNVMTGCPRKVRYDNTPVPRKSIAVKPLYGKGFGGVKPAF